MYLLTEWEGMTGKYLVRGHGVRTERIYHMTTALFLFIYLFFSGNKIRYRNVHLRRSFWPKSWDLNSNKVSSHLAKSRTRS